MSDSNLPLWDVLRNWWDILQEVDTRASTIVVAASNSIDPTLAPAAYRCSGAADEVEINAALTAAAAVGGEVLLLEGLYVTAAPIIYPGNSLVLRGLGRATLIQPAAVAGNAIAVTGRDDIVIRDLAIDTKTGGTFGHCIFIEDGSDRFRIENVWIIDSDLDGIHVEGTTIDTGHIEGCHILNADGTGIEVDMDAANFMYRLHVDGNDVRNCATGILFASSGGNHYCEITNNVVLSCTADGILVLDGDYSMIRGNICISNGGEGIDLLSTEHAQVLGNNCQGNTLDGIYITTSNNIIVVGNTCQGNTLSGISLLSSNGCNVTGNTCEENVRHGIYMESSNNNMVVGNACNGNDSGDTGTYDGISILVAVSNLILGNQCRDNDGWGIMVGNASDYNKVSNNYTNGNTAGSIRVNNANCDNTQIEFNTVEEGAPSDVGTLTRSYGNYDPSANAFVGDVGAAPF